MMMNIDELESIVGSLKKDLTDTSVPSDAEFHQMAYETQDIDSQMMFDFFEGSLSAEDVKLVNEHAGKSQLFLSCLVGIGEQVLESKKEEQLTHPTPPTLFFWLNNQLNDELSVRVKGHVAVSYTHLTLPTKA